MLRQYFLPLVFTDRANFLDIPFNCQKGIKSIFNVL